MRDDFAVFILSHGRPESVVTVQSLQRSNYTGKWYIIVDNEDDLLYNYIDIFGKDKIIVFDKAQAALMTDTCENSGKRNAVVFARNKCFDIAKELKLNYFLELDDDYTRFEYRYEQEGKLMTQLITDFDSVAEQMIEFLETSGALTVAFSQGGDFIGGVESQNFRKKIVRKAMNSFFCKVDRPFQFFGLINEDVNTYVTLGNRGDLFLTYSPLSLIQGVTQRNTGGLTDIYLDLGTYQKSFYSVVCSPSCVCVNMMGDKHQRIHHKVDWDSCCPKILSSNFKKR